MGTTSYDFSNEVVVVTGGSSGIGRAIALRFGESGATVVNADIDEETKDPGGELPTHRAIEERDGDAEFVRTDVSDPDDLVAVIEAARDFGGVDVMVNNAGIYIDRPFREVTPEEFDKIHTVNVRGVYFGSQLAANDMIERGEPGSIINTASISSNVAQPGQVHYDSTKGAVQMITRGAALELAEHGIRVNAVAPGVIATEIMEGWSKGATDAIKNEELVKRPPIGRAGVPEDIAGPAVFLASDDADYITGTLLDVDGGWQIF
ncbi:MAG: SDR family oxidoreductase [Natronomonas sp.]|jgi:NAD(P)-dependent dehydrogenase (short-subunit alcohol dehydrogenase family)|uniref:SDR family NAD(P)-dependent oxidoreductase n=1 Tax=Natronomonas sp. TaxID=2184060 RepID=UPI00287038AE|nr:SDR family oxidoreductase [Natronomonas sp.]MDR9429390.1 SDR family oxidoreductase [Natronomonas sp.]